MSNTEHNKEIPFGSFLGSLKNKIILLTLASVLISTASIAAVVYLRYEQFARESAIEYMAGETRLIAQRFKASYDQMRNDAQVLSGTPPINGILRARANKGIDPVDGSTTAIWRQRLATIFQSIITTRPFYTQVRYIGANGMELVRVNRTDSGSEVVRLEDLQNKSGEPYFQDGIKLDKGQYYFSEVTYNRERGAVDPTLTPTVRAVIPIFSDSGTLLGLVVINADYAKMLRFEFETIKPEHDTLVVNGAGDYMERDDAGNIHPLQLHYNYTETPPAFIREILGTDSNEEVFAVGDDLSYFVRLDVDPQHANAYLGVITRLPKAELLAPANQALMFSLMLGALLVVVCLIVSFVLANRFMAPLNRMAEEIRNTPGHIEPEKLPLDRPDEIGELARAFNERERALAASEERFRSAIENAPIGMALLDLDGRWLKVNDALCKFLGYDEDELKNLTFQDLTHPDDLEGDLALVEKLLEGEIDTYQLEKRYIDKTGTTIWGLLSVSLARDETGKPVYFISQILDVTHRREMERLQTEFISTVNHELRTPLTAIQGSLGLLMSKCDSRADSKEKTLLANSYESCQRLTRLVNDILDVEKMAIGKMTYNFETVEICALIGQIVESQAPLAEKWKVRIETELPKTEIFARIDKDRFTQALVNIISNAAKFSADGDRIIVSAERLADDNTRISVQDFGPGIPVAFRDRIFGKFAQADGSSTRKVQGSGLGLNITKSIVEAFGGTIDFQTEEGKGTTFFFVLPSIEPEARSA